MMNTARITEEELILIEEMTDKELINACVSFQKLIKLGAHAKLMMEIIQEELERRNIIN